MTCVVIKQGAGDECSMESVLAGKVKRPLVTSRGCSVRAELAVRERRIFQDSRTT